jgi:hypothetical protein
MLKKCGLKMVFLKKKKTSTFIVFRAEMLSKKLKFIGINNLIYILTLSPSRVTSNSSLISGAQHMIYLTKMRGE